MLTSETTKNFWAYMQSEFGSSVEEKNNSAVMKAAAALLDVLDIQDKEQFMKDFVTTLYKTIYTPFKIGIEEPASRWSLWSQVRVCVHEHQHVVQGEREGWPTFCSRYLTSSSYRAGYEAEAYGCDLEMEYYKTGQILDIDQRVSMLKDYGCKDVDIEQAKQMLLLRSEIVKQGVVENMATVKAIDWLNTHVPDLGLSI